MAVGEFAGVKVLLIEDQLFIRSMTARMLSGIGFREILQARDGKEAIDLMSSVGETVDVVLCDLKMPHMDGFEFVTKLRALPLETVARVPVVVLTGTSDADSVQRLRTLGIAGYIVKPASTQTIVERVRAALRTAKK
jgi:DNA-binding NarL/FixJ family response regulator